MEKKTKYILITLSIIIIVTIVVILIELQNPLRKSQTEIRERMLALTPIGTSMDDVLKVIESNKEWETMYVSYENGYSRPDLRDIADSEFKRPTINGGKLIRIIAGRYREPFKVSVSTYWNFDENSKLVDIYVNKISAGL